MAGTAASDRADRPAPRTDAPAVNLDVRRALLVATAVIVGVWLVLIVFWHDAPFALTFDDAFYYLTIGRNMATGQGSTFDGLNLTNGYHPLWQLIATIPFRIGLDDLDAARLLLIIQLAIGWGATLALLSSTVSRALDGWPPVSRRRGAKEGAARAGAATLALTLVLVGASPFVVKLFVSGLESGIAATCDAALLYLAVRGRGRWIDGTTLKFRLGAGALFAVTFLARTDAIILLACLGLWVVAEAIVNRTPGAVRKVVELFALPVVVIGLYLVSNQAWFGTPWQISGLTKRAPLTASTVAVFAVFVAVAALIGWQAFRSFRRSPARDAVGRFPVAGRFAAQTGWFASFCVLIVGYYNVLQLQQWLWYYAPLGLYLVALLLLAVADMSGAALRDAPESASASRAIRPVQIIVGFLFVALLVYTGWQFTDPDLRSIQIANANTGRWIDDHLPDDAVLASWDAGAIGYFAHRHVVNLDGVVNSYDFYLKNRAGQGAAFLACDHVTYVTNHGSNDNGEDPGMRAFIKDLSGQAAADNARIVFTEPFDYSGVLVGANGSDSSSGPTAVHVYQFDPAVCPPSPPE
jgi:hypothetical protein